MWGHVTGRTTVLRGIVHLIIFAVFLFFAVVPWSFEHGNPLARRQPV
jgi:hypothetical protein